MRHLPGRIAQVQQERRNRVRHGRTLGSQNPIAANIVTLYPQFAGELGSVTGRDLEEYDRITGRYVIVFPLLLLFELVFTAVSPVAAIGDYANISFAGFID